MVIESGASEAESTAAPARPAANARLWRVQLATSVMAIIALVSALYLARGFFIPLLIGILASYALHPLVDRIESCRVPRSVGAALVLAMVVACFSWIGVSVSNDAVALIEKLPEAAHNLRKNLSTARSGAPTALQNMQQAAHELQGAAVDASAQTKAGVKTSISAAAAMAPEPTWLRDYTLAQSALLVTVAAQTPIVLLLTYFLLASGAHFRRKLVQLVGPTLTHKKDAVRILDEIDAQVQRYLLATLLSNALLALVTWLAFMALGLDQAGVWGVAAGIFHFVPYLGPALIALALGSWEMSFILLASFYQ